MSYSWHSQSVPSTCDEAAAACPMSPWKRWLCVIALLVTAPVWFLAMLLILMALIAWGIGQTLLED